MRALTRVKMLGPMLWVAAAIVALVGFAASSVTARPTPTPTPATTSTPATVTPGGPIVVTASTITNGGGGGDGTGTNNSPPIVCTWYTDYNDDLTAEFFGQTKTIDGIFYRQWIRVCPPPQQPVTLFWRAETTPLELAENAFAKTTALLPTPTLGMSPPNLITYAKYDTWLWTDPDQWHDVKVPASVQTIQGTLTVTVTATPLRLVFDPGEPDSTPFVCTGPGQAWTPALGEDATSPCMYEYYHSSSISPTGAFNAQWSIVWNITWTSIGPAGTAGGVLAEEFVTTNAEQITVKEIQALVTAVD